jgi:hypothetical protein
MPDDFQFQESPDEGAFDAQSMLDSVGGGGGTTSPAEDTSAPVESTPAPAAAQTPAQVAAEIEFSWNGKQVKVPVSDPRVKQWASQGYDYSQRISDVQKRQTEIDQRAQSLSEIENRYKPIDDYVRENPQFWERVTSEWQREQSGGQAIDPNNPLVKHIQNLESKLGTVEKITQSIEQERVALQQKAEDSALDTEIQSLREKHPELDFGTVDASGTSLEQRVIKHAMENKLGSFRAAFRDLLHDDLVKKAEERGKEVVSKNIQQRTKQGLLGTSPTPTRGVSDAQNIKHKSYESLADEAIAWMASGSQ